LAPRLREEYRFRIFKMKVLKRTFRRDAEGATGGWRELLVNDGKNYNLHFQKTFLR
jgi:hypothetical protein